MATSHIQRCAKCNHILITHPNRQIDRESFSGYCKRCSKNLGNQQAIEQHPIIDTHLTDSYLIPHLRFFNLTPAFRHRVVKNNLENNLRLTP